MSNLLKKGVFDSVIQFLAISGSRIFLVASIPLFSIYFPSEDIIKVDFFLISSSLILILITLGIDSGLAIVADKKKQTHLSQYFWAAFFLVVLFSFVFFSISLLIVETNIEENFDFNDYKSSFLYAFNNAIILVVFSFFRWRGQVKSASLLILLANTTGISIAYILIVLNKSIVSFLDGLVIGSSLGSVLCLLYTYQCLGFLNPVVFRKRVYLLAVRLVKLSLPFCIASMLLLSRRLVDRSIILFFGNALLLGGYITTSRSGELVAFFISIPAIGLSPLILQYAKEKKGKNLARLVYIIYAYLNLFLSISTFIAWKYFEGFLPENLLNVYPMIPSIIIGTLIFSQTYIAGYGFIIKKDTKHIATLSFLFLISYIIIALPFAASGKLKFAISIGYIGSSLIYSTTFIYLSEKRFSFGYPIKKVTATNIFISCIAIAPFL